MQLFEQLRLLLRITRSQGIARRYFVTNGFDGALTMLGLTMGFYASGGIDLAIAVGACLGTAIALGISGLSSAYMSEAAERKKELHELEHAMVAELGETFYGQAARLVPLIIALVNGLSPFCISLLIITPLWLGQSSVILPLAPLESTIAVAFCVIFMLGVFLGRISGSYWLWAGLRTVVIALVTSLLILLFAPA